MHEQTVDRKAPALDKQEDQADSLGLKDFVVETCEIVVATRVVGVYAD